MLKESAIAKGWWPFGRGRRLTPLDPVLDELRRRLAASPGSTRPDRWELPPPDPVWPPPNRLSR